MPPLKLLPLVVQIKDSWADDWVTMPNVEPISASLSAAAVSSFQFRLRYGLVKYPIETQITLKEHTQISRQWVRCLRSPYGDTDILFQGRIESDTRDLYGAVSGVQVFTAYDGSQILSKIQIHTSIVLEDTYGMVMDSVLPFNSHPTSRQKTSNRSGSKIDGNYIFKKDGSDWTVDNAIEYLIGEFVNEDDTPVWTVTGSIPNVLEPLALSNTVTAMGFLQALLNQQSGYSFVVLPNKDGFELKLFSMAVKDVTFGSVTVPKNPNSVKVTNKSNPEIALRIEETQVNNYKRVTVFGAAMVVCRSFAVDTDELTQDWPSDLNDPLVATYEVSDNEERRDPRFKNLWCRFVVNEYPAKWTIDNNPTLEPDGTLNFGLSAPVPQFSASLESLPMRTGNDYSTGMPGTEYEGEFLSPMFFVKGILGDWREFSDAPISADMIALPEKIGIHIRTAYPHVMAADNYGFESFKGPIGSILRSNEAVLTIAFKSHQRLQRFHEESGAKKSDGEIIIKVEDAEYWWVADNTAIGIQGVNDESKGDLKRITSPEGITIRDDGPKLDRVMAGAVARYITPRGKASGSADGLFAWHLDIGKVLVTDDPDVQSILTMVSWTFEEGYKTTLKSGFAI